MYFTSLGCKEDKYGTFSSDYNHFTFRRGVYCRFEQKHFAQIATVFAALATLGTLLVAGQWFADGHQSVTYDIVSFDKTAIFGVTLDAVSTLIAFAVVALGFLICLYSCGYLTDKNREHPHNGLPRFYAFLLIFIGAMAGLVYSSTLAGQLLFFEITGDVLGH